MYAAVPDIKQAKHTTSPSTGPRTGAVQSAFFVLQFTELDIHRGVIRENRQVQRQR